MDWDEFIKKINNIEAAVDCKSLFKLIEVEFGSWHEMAFAILEMKLNDKVSYSNINFSITKNEKDGYSYIHALALTKQLEDFKKEYTR